MKVSKVISQFAMASSDPVELRRVARSLGNELPRNRVDALREFRARITSVPIGTQDEVIVEEVSYATGYVAGMVDVSTEYEAAVSFDDQSDRLPADLAKGIELAIRLLRQHGASAYHSSHALHTVATSVLGDPLVAAEAVALWEREARAAHLIERRSAEGTSQSVPVAVAASGSVPTAVPDELLWERASTSRSFLDETEPRRPSILRAMTEPLIDLDADAEPSRPVPITR